MFRIGDQYHLAAPRADMHHLAEHAAAIDHGLVHVHAIVRALVDDQALARILPRRLGERAAALAGVAAPSARQRCLPP